MKWDIDEVSDIKGNKTGDDEEWERNVKRKHKSSKLRKSRNGEANNGWDGSEKSKSSAHRNDFRKQPGGSSRGDSDEDDSKELCSKQVKKKPEESTLEKLSNWYQDGELETKHDGGDKPGTGHS
ncbi:hypothetical protein Nepgr_010805 [Nepenthes gracilis]|uniref:Uncharacterized protein n=1 Tax=Nepenthes gracilis TaxID=150966 RepID=A0AAD3SDY3_NEPGR|nr:hypothetical protein Nepgr_010805 [Nepenthes gracilis]